MLIEEHVAALDAHGRDLGGAARRAGLDAAVPTCPGWTVADLLGHVGMVHRWAAAIVGTPLTAMPTPDDDAVIAADTPAGPELFDWYDEGHADLVRTLRTAPCDVACWQFMRAVTPLAFWARRQGHETAVHRADAEAAAGIGPEPASFATDLASDGIDELLTGFLPRSSRIRHEPPRTLAVIATDAGLTWRVEISTERPRVSRESDPALPVDASISGAAAALYLALWNRRSLAGLDVTGDRDLFGRWSDQVTITWS